MQHWTITRDADGLAWLTFDKAGATVNTLSAAVLAELNDALDILDADAPKGLVIRSGKANGFIAGADVDEFGEVNNDAGALAIVKRGWDTFERLATRPVPDTGAGARLLPGRRTRIGACVPLSRGRRRARDAAGLARGDAGHRSRLGRHQATATAGGRARGPRHAADGQDDRCAAREEARASPTSAFPSGSWTTRRAACCARCRRRARFRSLCR